MSIIKDINICHISAQTKEACDKSVSLDELTKAVKGLASNKSPGLGGHPCEF